MSDDKGDVGKPMRTEELALMRIFAGGAQPTELDIQRGIDAAMREVVSRPYNPNALRAPEPVRVNAPEVAEPTKRGSGWVEAKPLAQRNKFEKELVDALAEKFVGGPNSIKE